MAAYQQEKYGLTEVWTGVNLSKQSKIKLKKEGKQVLTMTDMFHEATHVEFLNPDKYPRLGIREGTMYELKFGFVPGGIHGGEYHVIDDEGRLNVGALLCLQSVFYK